MYAKIGGTHLGCGGTEESSSGRAVVSTYHIVKVARVSLDSKSTKAKKVKKSNNPITAFFLKKDAANSDSDNESSCEQSSSQGY